MRKRKPTLLGAAGGVLGGAGVAGLIWGNVREFHPDRIGIVLLILGAMLICTKSLRMKGLAADEIYNLGRERGEGDAYDEGYRDGLDDGRRERLAVVELHPKCAECSTPLVRAADRGRV